MPHAVAHIFEWIKEYSKVHAIPYSNDRRLFSNHCLLLRATNKWHTLLVVKKVHRVIES